MATQARWCARHGLSLRFADPGPGNCPARVPKKPKGITSVSKACFSWCWMSPGPVPLRSAVWWALKTGLPQSDECGRSAGPGPCTDHWRLNTKIDQEHSRTKFPLHLYSWTQPLIANPRGTGSWKLNLREPCAVPKPALSSDLPKTLFLSLFSQCRLLSSKPFYSRRRIAICWHYSLTWDMQDE